MKKIIKRATAIALAWLLVGTSLPMNGEVHALNEPNNVKLLPTVTVDYTNPLYSEAGADQGTAEQSAVVSAPLLWTSAVDADEYVETLSQAAEILREQLKAREAMPQVNVHLNEYNVQIAMDLFDLAIAHTGVPVEGDYIEWQYAGFTVSISGYNSADGYFLTFTYRMRYYTTAEQEEEMNLAVEELLDEVIEDSMTDYEKVCAIYEWLCQNIYYDYIHLEDTSYMLKHTAYAALIDRMSVCQGYAVLLYRLMLEVGIDCRLISGIGNGGPHAWNIICLDGNYYCVDATWDATYRQAGWDYQYFLRGSLYFGDHHPDTTAEFDAAYPVSPTDYVHEQPHVHTYESEVIPATCTSEGYTLHCCSECGDSYSDSETPVLPHSFGEWQITIPAQLGIAGTEERECTGCHGRESREIPALTYIKGDINGDALVTENDITVLRQYLCGVAVDVNAEALDANGDGYVNMRDVAVLAQYLAGLAVELQ